MTLPLVPGAPGVYRVPKIPARELTAVRMDVAAFAGVAPRGPARVPVYDAPWADQPCGPGEEQPEFLRSVAVPVESWDAYRRLYGGFEGPGLLPYAVASFFDQGGRRAYVVRTVHAYGGPDDLLGVAAGDVAGAHAQGGGPLRLRARDEGSWGNRLRAGIGFSVRPFPFDPSRASTTEIVVPVNVVVWQGTLLRLRTGAPGPLLRFVSGVWDTWDPGTGARDRHLTLSAALPAPPLRGEVVEAVLDLDDGDGRQERHEELGLDAAHPRWVAAVLYGESALVWPDPAWAYDALLPDDVVGLRAPAPPAPPAGADAAGQFRGGVDRWADIVPGDFFDEDWVPGNVCPGAGVQAVAELPDLAMLLAPDLYSPGPLAARVPANPANPGNSDFGTCTPEAPLQLTAAVPDLDGLRLDPRLPDQLETIAALQQRLIDFAESAGRLVVLLDVPPGLRERGVLAWRGRFTSMQAACYHPWLLVARPDDARDALVAVPPSAAGAGIVAQREWLVGVPHGPANVLAAGVVDVAERIAPAEHARLHPFGINVFTIERDGVMLSAARTLSTDPAWRQLSVRRLVTLIERTLEIEMQWAAFEPNNEALRADVGRMLRNFLRRLWRAQAFRGATEDEAFFVRCDDALNPPAVLDQGRLVAEIGVAPAEPLEFIVLRLDRAGDGQLTVEG